MFLLPQMELILAVGLKLSSKSDIKLPRSYRQTPNDGEKKRERKQGWIRSGIKQKYLLDTDDTTAHTPHI